MMDCPRTAEILMAEHDGETVDTVELAEAHEHCAACAECMTLMAMITRIDTAPAMRAPEELVARLVAISAEAASDIREEEIAARALAEASLTSGLGITESGPAASRSERPKSFAEMWTPRFTAFAAAAAVLLVALGAGTVALLGQLGSAERAGDEVIMLESAPSAPEDDGAAADYSAATAPEAGEARSADITGPAPSYVAFDRTVWLLESSGDPAPSTLTTAGVVTSSLMAGGEVTEHTAFLDAGDALWVRAPDGSYRRFTRVVRTLGLQPYALVSDAPIARYGQWPKLPARFTPPEADDGSPTFTRYGFDDLGRDIFAPGMGSTTDGFAVAPGTAADDPAAGNPGWTWWEPIR